MSDHVGYSSNEEIPGSGVYLVHHADGHMAAQLVTLLYGQRFPFCRHCGTLAFEPVVIAHNAGYYENLQVPDATSADA